jgi:2,4-dienoyl-CoA reductase-like NADH-dependent reductase (Old Yellow Enzyme family)/thioredoxin reductase
VGGKNEFFQLTLSHESDYLHTLKTALEENMLQHLFEPFEIKGRRLKNRIVMPALASFLIEDDGSITDKTVEHYRRRAAGGPAMVIVEAHAVSEEGIVSLHQARIFDDRFIEGLSRIARVMKSEGALPAIQIHHSGRQTSSRVIKRKPLAPSNLPCPTISGEVEPLSLEGIQDIITKFGDSAVRAVQAGFELIEIHGAHGYLINQFMSKFSNIREDAFGGDTTRRARFAVDIVKEVRRRVGEDFPISFKISAQEFVPGGLDVTESIEILKLLVAAGIDIVQVSAGNDATPEWICQPMFMEKACLSDSAAMIKKELRIPVMTVGRINDPVVADAIIREGKADLVCMGRGLLADPEMPKKAQAGNLDDIRICIACNTCMESIFRRGRVECLVNPSLGREKEMEMRPAEKRKKVMVVGGGPGGLHAGWVAAMRGHEVHLFERQSRLGGQLNLGSVTKYKKEILSLIDFQKKQVEKAGIHVHLNSEVTLETVKREKPDVVILSTGATPILPKVPGIERSTVIGLSEVLNGDPPEKKRAVVIGGGATGCEVAHHLAEHGSSVTIVEQLPKIALNLESITRKVLLVELRQQGVRFLTGHKLSKIEETGVLVTGEDGIESFIEADAVIIAIGNRPDNTLYEQIQPLGIPLYQIGDCLEPRSAKAAISEAATIGRSI